MKIGILTFHRSINNGAVIQCYSLSQRLQQEFPEAVVEVIDYHMPKVAASYDATLAQYLKDGSLRIKLKKLALLILNPGTLRWKKRRKKVFESVVNVLPLSDVCIFDDDVQKLFDYINTNYDVVIAGSDAIWNYNTRGFPNPYFLDHSLRCGKLSYAASCYGMSYERIPQDQKARIREILDSYQFLGVRDEESAKFVSHVGGTIQPVHTCDPTVFLDVNSLPVDEEQLREKLKDKGFDFSRPAIGVMGTDQMCGFVRTLYGGQYQIVALYNYCKGADVNLYDLTPYEWAYVFRFFRLTFTTFFHGTLLSLRNGTPVICIALETEYSKTHMTKVEDFLLRIGLQDCYFKTDCRQMNLEAIKEKADMLLAKDFRTEICMRMDQEAESCGPFLEAVAAVLKAKQKEIQ